MIISTMKIDSMVLNHPVEVKIAMPCSIMNVGKRFSVIFALHPSLSDADLFFNRLNIAEYSEKYKFILVAPSLQNSFFVNSHLGDYADFLDVELYPMMCKLLPIKESINDRYVLGISMGAFGALHWYKRHPEYFTKAFLISGYYDINLDCHKDLPKQRKSFALSKTVNPMLKGIIDSRAEYSLNEQFFCKSDLKSLKLNLFYGKNDLLTVHQNETLYKICSDANISVTVNPVEGEHDITAFKNAIEKTMQML